MKKLLLLPIAFLLLTACSSKEKRHVDDHNIDLDKPVKMETVTPFFKFNAITYYHTDITNAEWIEISKKRDKKTLNEQNLTDLLIGNLSPSSLNDTSYISKVEKLYTLKIEIDKDKTQRFKDLFSEKYSGNFSFAACDPAYRDVLIFKQEDNVTGIARICFGCELFEILGSKQNTDGFGQMGDWEKFHILLGELLPKGSKLDF